LHRCYSAVKAIKYAYTEHGEAGGSDLPNILGDKIRKLRKEKGLTLDKLAELSGSSKSYIWELENKTPPRPSADKLAKIAEQLDTTIEYLLDEGEGLSQEDATDARFYRQYRKMDSATKAKVRQIIKLWDEDS
jgi:transcriptional regulator with XRE-family HTH domain